MDAAKFIFHGGRRPLHSYVQKDGSLLLKPTRIFDKLDAICFTPFEGIARDYAARAAIHSPHRDPLKGVVFKIRADTIANLEVQSPWELIVQGNKPITVPAGAWEAVQMRPIKDLLAEATSNGWKDTIEHLHILARHERSNYDRVTEIQERLVELDEYQNGPGYEDEDLIMRFENAPAFTHNGATYVLEGLSGACTRNGLPCKLDDLSDAAHQEEQLLKPKQAHYAVGFSYDQTSRRGNYRAELHMENAEGNVQVKARYDYDLLKRQFALHFYEKKGSDFELVGYVDRTAFPFVPDEKLTPDQTKSVVQRMGEQFTRAFASSRLTGTNPAWLAIGEDPLGPPKPTKFSIENGKLVINDIVLRKAVELAEKNMKGRQPVALAVHNAAKRYDLADSEVGHALGLMANMAKQREPLSVRLEHGITQLHKLMGGDAKPHGFGTREKPEIPPLLRLEAEEAVRTKSIYAELAHELLATHKTAQVIAADEKKFELPLEMS